MFQKYYVNIILRQCHKTTPYHRLTLFLIEVLPLVDALRAAQRRPAATATAFDLLFIIHIASRKVFADSHIISLPNQLTTFLHFTTCNSLRACSGFSSRLADRQT